MTQPQLIHWVLLLGCVALALRQGVHDLVEGVDHEDCKSGCYRVARIANLFIASGEVAFSALILFRQFWAITGLAFCFGLLVAHHLFLLRPAPETHPIVKLLGEAQILKLWGVFMCFALGIPIALLLWLRPIFAIH